MYILRDILYFIVHVVIIDTSHMAMNALHTQLRWYHKMPINVTRNENYQVWKSAKEIHFGLQIEIDLVAFSLSSSGIEIIDFMK